MRKGKYNKNGMSDKIHKIRPYFAVFQWVRVVISTENQLMVTSTLYQLPIYRQPVQNRLAN
jgi:hypothetical protein